MKVHIPKTIEAMELKKFGAVSDTLIAEINLWLAGVAA